jgi:retinol-binding protein 3
MRILIAHVFVLGSAMAQSSSPALDASERTAIIDKAALELNRAYVFPETARKMEADLRERQKRGEFDALTDPQKFAEKLTADLQSVSHDKHLRVRYSEEPIPDRPDGPPPLEEVERQRKNMARLNYGWEKLERLEGNIGYVDLRGFMPAEFSAPTAVAAMNFLANTGALIFDLRKNGGGDPATVALISTYLFEGDPVHLNSLYWRPTDATQQWWTLPYVPGPRFGAKKPVYVLTADGTFSAAEEFTYNLKNLKRATIVGETTGGGAHPGDAARLSAHFMMFLPSGRAINPISKTNWEGTGVEPDVKVTAELAFKTAYLDALKKTLPGVEGPIRRKQTEEKIGLLEKELAASKP